MNRRNFAANAVGLAATSRLWLEQDLTAQTCGTLPPVTTAQPFVFPNAPQVVERPSVLELADTTNPARVTQLRRLREATQRMKSLPATNPLRFDKQVNLHCNHCGVGAGEIHYNWQFLPWHRAMLYFHERILNHLLPAQAGETPIRVPYWPWDAWSNPANRVAPEIYAATGQSLWQTRNPAGPLPEDRVDVRSSLILPDAASFIGTANSSSATSSGAHAHVHNWALAILSNVRYSPLDPLFYAHHANMDRLWSSWIALGGGRANPNFGGLKAYFFDENGTWRSVELNSFRSEAALGYRYSSLMQLEHTPSPGNISVLMTANEMTRINDETTAVKRGATTTVLLRGVKLGALAEESDFGVFVDSPGDTSAASPNLLGRFSTIAPLGRNEPAGGLTIAVRAQPLHRHLGGKPKLVIRALDGQGKSKGSGIPLRAANVSLL